jgi:hypothetical protein
MLKIDGQHTELGWHSTIISPAIIPTPVIPSAIVSTGIWFFPCIRLLTNVTIIVVVAVDVAVAVAGLFFPSINSIFPSPIRLPVISGIIAAPNGQQQDQHPP